MYVWVSEAYPIAQSNYSEEKKQRLEHVINNSRSELKIINM